MGRSILVKTTILALLVPLATGCGDDEGLVGVFSRGAPARVMFTTTAAAGGHVFYDTLTVDSLTARYTTATTCMAPITQVVCGTVERRSGAVALSVIEQLFATAQSKAFRNLRATYEREGGHVPPDGSSYRLTVTVAERMRMVTWEGGATLPLVLTEYQCLLLAARGALILCD